jgi:hypothetical protein
MITKNTKRRSRNAQGEKFSLSEMDDQSAQKEIHPSFEAMAKRFRASYEIMKETHPDLAMMNLAWFHLSMAHVRQPGAVEDTERFGGGKGETDFNEFRRLYHGARDLMRLPEEERARINSYVSS